MIIEWHRSPFISGVMVTTVPERRAFALRAIEDFQAQNWPHKELVVVNATGVPFPKLKDVVEFSARNPADNLRGFALSQCRGEWVADWQDDCRYSPRYLRSLARLRDKNKRVSLLAYMGVCMDDESKVSVDNDGQSFSLGFRFAFSPSGPVIWLDKPELVTRYYACKAAA